MRYLQALVLLAFLAAVGIFAVQNTQTVTVQFLQWGVSAPIAALVVGVYVLGMMSGGTVVAFVAGSIRRVRERPGK